MPPGALGVSFFYHLTHKLERLDKSVYFVGLDGSRSIDSLLSADLQIADDETTHRVPSGEVIFRSLAEARKGGLLPEILIVCPNPDQLLQVVSSLVTLIEQIWNETPDPDEDLQLPVIILSSNGIYFQRVRQMFIEKLEESTLLGRLPDLWPDHMPRIIGHLLRGVTIQTGMRRGSGASTVYHPGPSGISTLAGGSEKVRARCHEVLAERGGRFELTQGASPTRLEFEKAIVNLAGNLLGLIHAFDEGGHFHPLTVGDIFVSDHQAAVRELADHVFQVGQAVKAFAPSDDFETIFAQILERCRSVQHHVPSSLQAAVIQIEAGTLEAKFPPTETWLIDPLIRYARSADLSDAATYFEGLRETLIAKLQIAVERQKQHQLQVIEA